MTALKVIWGIAKRKAGLFITVAVVVLSTVVATLLPPLALERIVNTLTAGGGVDAYIAVGYFGLIAASSLLEALREYLLTLTGQTITHGLRSALTAKLHRLSAAQLSSLEPGVVSSRFIGDVDTVESLFTSGIVGMVADMLRVISIFAILFVKNPGLAALLLVIVPFIYAFTRYVQKRSLSAQIENRAALGRAGGLIPETIHNIRTVHSLGAEGYMRDKYDGFIQESFVATEQTSFYDAIYSPVIQVLSAAVTSLVMVLAATGAPGIFEFFGMSVGTAVAVITYISQVFSPLEAIGKEIQTIQQAGAGVHRITEFFSLEERQEDGSSDWDKAAAPGPAIVFDRVSFRYEEDVPVLDNLSFTVDVGEQLTLAGRTGAGKSTAFKLILGLYRPLAGRVLVCGHDASSIPDACRRRTLGIVEQSFYMVPGSVRDQIALYDEDITDEDVRKAAATVGIDEAIQSLPQGYDTAVARELFSQGQWALISIARAIAANPQILLLDEITANLDADTEKRVLRALDAASKGRTVLSISHRLYAQTGGRVVEIGGE